MNYVEQIDQITLYSASSELIDARNEFNDSLVENGLISEEFRNSGELDKFQIDEATGTDLLEHTLMGDESGGGHHLPTMLAVKPGERIVASTISDVERPHKSYSRFKKDQKIQDNGVFRAMDVTIVDAGGNNIKKDRGSTMFPNEWSTQDVIESIVSASESPSTYNAQHDMNIHDTVVNNVRVRAISSPRTGKIITGYPR